MLAEWLSDPTKVSASILMMAAIVAFALGKVITVGHHMQVVAIMQARIDDLAKDRDQYKELVLRSTATADRALQVAEQQVRKN